MTDIEIPLGKRTKLYRFFEILPGAISIGAILLLIVLSIFSPPGGFTLYSGTGSTDLCAGDYYCLSDYPGASGYATYFVAELG